MQKIGFFGGCFNPPINTHIKIAKELIEKKMLDKVIFVPVGDYYPKKELAPAIHRYNMLKISCKDNKNIEVEDIVVKQEKRLYATDTLKMLYNKYSSKADIYYIMGSDNFKKINTWKDYENLIEKYKFIVIERQEHKLETNKINIIYTQINKEDEINSTKIRNMIKRNEDVTKWINKETLEYIKENKLYKN